MVAKKIKKIYNITNFNSAVIFLRMTKLSLSRLPEKYRGWFSSSRLVILGFALVILVGTGLLLLPISVKDGVRLSFIDALFTATSATCVTGLVVKNTFATFSGFGQAVILLLIQIGGLGFMTVYASLILMVGRKFTLEGRLSLRDNLAQIDIGEVKTLLSRIMKLTFIIETAGAVILTCAFTKYYSFGTAVWKGIFHSVSAFCNAGFDIIDIGGGSMTPFGNDPVILITVCALIILGGLGFIVFSDFIKYKTTRKLSIHTKIVLITTAVLLTAGTIIIMAAEYNNSATFGNMNFGYKLLNSFFISTTARTAGFANIDITNLSRVSIPLVIFLMFIGASPGSTGGGIKTTTLFVLLMAVGTSVLKQKQTIVGYKRIGQETVTKAVSVFMLAMLMFIVSFFVLMLSEPNLTNQQIIFEQTSAYATVGLSLNSTAELSLVGKLVIIFNMFFGRLGALTILIAFAKGKDRRETKIKYPEANINI